ncbi:leucine-rich repeat neuronal protein 4 [Scophthalmus maximus]|uniref:Si:ch1073-303k11.2 n=2 Tax=Scophthalmus maximus TaxID=52904 RepID=A0A8D3B7V3_SCOMX|nr:leucine-rich repeat neuronal protein 4 [Scophthalmus maximus]
MTSLCKNQAVLLLFLISSPLLHSHLFTHAASTSPPITRPRILFMTGLGSDDDYSDDYLDDHSSPPEVPSPVRIPVLNREARLCPYNPCLENQEPCANLAVQSGCLCPGLSGADQPPHAPRIQALLPISEGDDRGKVEVQWCAPSSVVSGYRVVVEGTDGDALEFGDALRRGSLASLEVGTKVCVVAVNNAGHSSPSEFSCNRYDPPESSEHNVFAWVISGGVALLLLVVITSLILWKQNMCQRGKRDSTDGLGNPSYSTEGTL